ncbi:MAG: preprotein translocase subunit YajC [Actinomycetes bacterium]
MITLLSTLIAAASKGGGSITGLLIILVPMGAILYMTIMPQRKQRQKQAALLSKLDVGDEVITTGGIIGTITFAEDDLYHVEIDTDVVIRIAKSGVARSLAEPAEPAAAKKGAKGASRSRKGLLAGALGGAAAESEENPQEAAEQDEADSQASSKQINLN